MIAKALSLSRPVRGGLSHRFDHPPGESPAAAHPYWRNLAERSSEGVVRVIKERGDSRAVLVVEDPRHGRCVLKTTCPVRRPRQGLANLAAARYVARSGSPIFPEIFEMSPCHTLERFVDGRAFRSWMDAEMDTGMIADFFRDLRTWSESGEFGAGRRRMDPDEVRWIARAYIGKCWSHSRYLRWPARLRAQWNLRRLGPEIRRRAGRLDAMANDLDLPLGVMCGDMGNKNLVVATDERRIYNIDYETLGAGHRGFDAAYFVSSVLKLDDSLARKNVLHEVVLTDDYLGGKAPGDYFRGLADLLTLIGRAVFRAGD